MPKRKPFLALLLLVSLSASAAVGQRGGGKAEPLRIEFKRGASSATLNDTVRGDEQAEYVFAAHKGQKVTLTLTARPAKSARFELKSADGVDYKFEYDGTKWAGLAPVTGDYFINVTRLSRKPGRANYSLRLAIK
jgi:hypothetical protein